MASQGPRYPGTTASEIGPSGDNDWISTSPISADDGSEAQITAATFDAGDRSYRLKATNFGFTIPAGALIDGIVVEIDRRCFAGAASDAEVRLYNPSGALDGFDQQKDTAWPAALTIDTYGSSVDNWLISDPSAAFINSSNFGVSLIVNADAANTDIGVDFIRVTVYYTEAPPPSTVSPSGVATAEALGSGTAKPGAVAMAITGITDVTEFGTPPVLRPGGVGVAPGAVGSAEVFGPVLLTNIWRILANAVASAEALGSLGLAPGGVPVGVSGLASLEALGSLGLLGLNRVSPIGIAAPTGGTPITIGQDSFTGAGTLTSHTAEVGGQWGIAEGSGISGTVNGTSVLGSSTVDNGAVQATIYDLDSIELADGDVYLTGLSDAFSAGAIVRASADHLNFYESIFSSFGASLSLMRRTGGSYFSVGSAGANPDNRFRLQVIGSNPTILRVRIWDPINAEPVTWDIDTTDNTAANQRASGPVSLQLKAVLDSNADPPIDDVSSGDDFLATTGGSGNAIGSPILKPSSVLVLTGLGSGEILGAHILTPGGVQVIPAGLASAAALGDAIVSIATISLIIDLNTLGIASGEGSGLGILLHGGVPIQPSGLSSLEGLGASLLFPGGVPITPGGIGDTAALGVAQLTGLARIVASAIGSAEVLGSDTLKIGGVLVVPVGMGSTEGVGGPAIFQGGGFILITGIGSSELLGSHVLSPGGVKFGITGIATSQALSNPILQALASVLPTGLSTGEALGLNTLRPGPVQIATLGVGSGEIFGLPLLPALSWILFPAGIDSTEALGTGLFIPRNYIQPVSLPLDSLVGDPLLQPGLVQIMVQSIDTGELIGPVTVELAALIKAIRWARTRPFGDARERPLSVTQSKFGETTRGES